MREAAEASAGKARTLLDDELKTVMGEAGRTIELKLQTANEETYRKLTAVVMEATAKNHSIAKLKQNLERLGGCGSGLQVTGGLSPSANT